MIRATLAVVIGTVACIDHTLPERPCQDDSTCVRGGAMGMCLPSPDSGTSWCAFTDGTCETGQRWGDRAGDDLDGQCGTSENSELTSSGASR